MCCTITSNVFIQVLKILFLHSLPTTSGTLLLRNDLIIVYLPLVLRQTVRLPKKLYFYSYFRHLCFSSRWLLFCCCFSRVSIAFTISCQVLFTSLLRDQKKRKALCRRRVNVETAKDDNLILHRNSSRIHYGCLPKNNSNEYQSLLPSFIIAFLKKMPK